MLTPQEVEERRFKTAKRGGYDMPDVDGFLDQLTADYSELFKENAVLKRKMKVLADKITEYQETEGAMRATLLAAQKMAKDMVEEATAKRAQILEETETIARARVEKLAADVAAEEARLAAAKSSLAAYIGNVRELLTQEEAFLASLPESTVPPAETEPVQIVSNDVAAEIGDSIGRMLEEEEETPAPAPAPAESDDLAKEIEELLEMDFDIKPEEPARRPARAAEDSPEEAPTRRLDLSELRFGRNYEIK